MPGRQSSRETSWATHQMKWAGVGMHGHAWAQRAPMAMPVRRWPCFIYNTYSRKKVLFVLFLGCCTTSKLAVAPSLDVVRVYIGTSLIKRLTTACIEPIPCRIHVCSYNYLSIMFNISTRKDGYDYLYNFFSCLLTCVVISHIGSHYWYTAHVSDKDRSMDACML
jgi:hypothetical protein